MEFDSEFTVAHLPEVTSAAAVVLPVAEKRLVACLYL